MFSDQQPAAPSLVAFNGRILFRDHRWYGSENRLEYAQRIKFWRFLSGNERFDANYWLTRIENTPERVAA